MRFATLCLLATCALVVSPLIAADEAKPVEGSMFLGGKTYQLKYAVAYETREGEETLTSVIASDRRIPIAEIKKELDEHEGNDRTLLLSQPYVRIVFKAGKPMYAMGAANGTNFGIGDSNIKAQLEVANGIAAGQAVLEKEGEDPFVRAFDLKFNVPFGLVPAAKPPASTAPVKPTVTGVFKGNGKAAKLAYVSVKPGEPFADKPSVLLVFTEKDHSKDPKPDFNASFGKYGSALIISAHEDGSIFGCQVAHSAHNKGSFSSIGSIRTDEFDLTDQQVSGKLSTEGEQEFFGQTWQVDITFAAPFNRPAAKVAATEPSASPKRPKSNPAESPRPNPSRAAPGIPAGKKPAIAPAQGSVAVHDLPFLKTATDVNYKKLVEMIDFKSKTGVTTLAAEIQKGLSDSGWEVDGADLVSANSTILRRKLGDAELTIFIRPSGSGSEVKVMSERLDWSNVNQ